MKLPFGLDDGNEILEKLTNVDDGNKILEKLTTLMDKVDEKDKEALATIHKKILQGFASLKDGAEESKEMLKKVMDEASSYLKKYKDYL